MKQRLLQYLTTKKECAAHAKEMTKRINRVRGIVKQLSDSNAKLSKEVEELETEIGVTIQENKEEYLKMTNDQEADDLLIKQLKKELEENSNTSGL